jgi:hypothetical protein
MTLDASHILNATARHDVTVVRLFRVSQQETA